MNQIIIAFLVLLTVGCGRNQISPEIEEGHLKVKQNNVLAPGPEYLNHEAAQTNRPTFRTGKHPAQRGQAICLCLPP